jgi:hypothetical protein
VVERLGSIDSLKHGDEGHKESEMGFGKVECLSCWNIEEERIGVKRLDPISGVKERTTLLMVQSIPSTSPFEAKCRGKTYEA